MLHASCAMREYKQVEADRRSQPGTWLNSLRVWLLQIARWMSPAIGPAYAAEVHDENHKLLARTSTLFAVSGSSSISILGVDFRDELGMAGVLVCIAIPILYIRLFAHVWRWNRDGDGIGFHRRSLVCLTLLGTLWGLLLVLLSGVGDISQQRMVAALLIGLVSTPVLAAPFSAAMAFWAPTATAALIAICVRQHPFDIYLLAGTLGYLGFIFLGMVLMNRALLERSTSRIRLLQQNSTISLFLRDYEESASDWLWETDASLRLCRVSPRFAQVSGRSAAELTGTVLSEILCRATPSEVPHTFLYLLNERAAFRDLLLPIAMVGESRWWSLTGRPHFDARAQFQGYHGIGSDQTDTIRAEKRIRYMATHDSLTGLANRQMFLDGLQAACERQAPDLCDRTGSCDGGSLLLLDLDRFKTVNDSLGHAAGDALLIAVAGRLRELVRDQDLVARLGGDEFAMLIPGMGRLASSALAARIIERLSQPYVLSEARVTIGASVGMTLLSQDGNDITSLLRNADLALYAAKSQGRGTWQLFEPRMRNAAVVLGSAG